MLMEADWTSQSGYLPNIGISTLLAYASDEEPGQSANRISAFFKLQLRRWIVERLSNATNLLA
jgi:hypothetical protein